MTVDKRSNQVDGARNRSREDKEVSASVRVSVRYGALTVTYGDRALEEDSKKNQVSGSCNIKQTIMKINVQQLHAKLMINLYHNICLPQNEKVFKSSHAAVLVIPDIYYFLS